MKEWGLPDYHLNKEIYSRVNAGSLNTELYPESPFQRKIMKEHQEAKLAKHRRQRPPNGLPPVTKKKRNKPDLEQPVNTLSNSSKYSPHRVSPFLSHTEPETKPKVARRTPQKPKARNGRTYTMLEQEEQILRQQLVERDLRLQESERRQEVSCN